MACFLYRQQKRINFCNLESVLLLDVRIVFLSPFSGLFTCSGQSRVVVMVPAVYCYSVNVLSVAAREFL